MNPLDSDETLFITLCNPNPTSSKTKDGPVYRVSFEMQQDEWMMFMDGQTKGMTLECAAQVSHRNSEKVEPKRDPDTVDLIDGVTDNEKNADLKGGALSVRSDRLARDPHFISFISERDPEYVAMCNNGGKHDNIDIGRCYIREGTGVHSRKELDHDETCAARFMNMIKNYTHWCMENGYG